MYAIQQSVPWRRMHSAAVRFDPLLRRAAPHANDDRAREDRVGQVPQPGERHGAVGRKLLRRDRLALYDTTPSHSTAPMAGIEDPADLFVLLGLRPEQGVDLVEQD